MKKCQNPECGAVIESYRSSKRKYCDDRCKNRAAYLKRLEEEADQIDMDRAFRKNYKRLKRLKDLGLDKITEQTLISHEFNFNVLHKDVYVRHKGKTIVASCLYDIKFIITENKELQFINT